MREVGVLFVLGCNECSETLKVMDAGSFMDEFNAHLAKPAQAVDVGALRKGFMTAESCGPDGHHLLKVKFQSLGDLQAAHNTLARALSGEKAGPAGDGWLLVPAKVTDQMIQAFSDVAWVNHHEEICGFRDAYEAMLSAAVVRPIRDSENDHA